MLQQAAGHLEGSSLPVGGENTHAVISAHRGLPSASLFTDLDQLEKGDHFLISVLDQKLCYEVDQIRTVEPEDTGDLAVEPGEDLVTLLTCTPYGVNTQRLLVRGHRVPYEEEVVEKEEKEYAFILPDEVLKQGYNRIGFQSEDDGAFTVKRVEIALKYGDVETHGYF